MTPDEQKRAAAVKALDYVKSGMKLGIGTGSTAEHLVRELAPRVHAGLDIVGVPTSERTRQLCEELGVPLSTLEDTPELDLTIDGADEFDAELRLVKGGGGALLREKIVAMASRRMIVITDASKQVERLGRFPLPIEVIPFGSSVTARLIEETARAHGCGGAIVRRADQFDEPFLTDTSNFIYDCFFEMIPDPDSLAVALNLIPGVVETGLFIGIASLIIVGTSDGVKLIGKGANHDQL